MVEVVHGIGTYALRNMIEVEIEKHRTIFVDLTQAFTKNPGSIKIEILGPEPHILKKYL